ncbi:MAG: 23S rRNA (uracil(1939)-C(5))-methyltransferase RlmD [Lachnospiraceae bacterium]|nr:23S rRNA (uracil(1939)-C(5))-methyltransferase RlmD [Lachnospiraceae bacterium]
MTYKKNDEIKTVIDGLGNDGEGIAHIDGFPFFIKDTAPGDHVTAKVMKVKRNLGFAKLISIDEPSADRIEPVCPVATACGGCTLQHISYEAELKYKDEKVYNCLRRIGGIDPEILDGVRQPIVPSEKTSRYRNKAQYPVGVDAEGRAVAGFYSGRTHHIVPETDCKLSPPEFRVILRTVLDFIDEFAVPVYDEVTGKGLIRHVLIRKGFDTGEILTVIVSAGEKIPHSDILAERLAGIPGMKSVCLNINPEKTNVILGKKIIPLFGEAFIEDKLCGLKFRISPLSFYQVNHDVAEKLYQCAIEYAGIKDFGSDTRPAEIWDICCGIGTITLAAAVQSDNCFVHGVEIVPEAIRDAKMNAELNGITNADFTAAAAEDYLPRYFREHPDAFADAVVLDPPRKGMAPEVLDILSKLKPERIVYVSCDPATLARDLKIFISSGYRLEHYRVFDQFSRTAHVETVCLLSKLHEAKHHVNVKVDMDELDLTSAEAKATYKEIEEWVQEHYGFHVTNLNIAQVKKKHGIIERENYNKPKSEDSRQPGCPEEKIKAIEDAMRHFQMI